VISFRHGLSYQPESNEILGEYVSCPPISPFGIRMEFWRGTASHLAAGDMVMVIVFDLKHSGPSPWVAQKYPTTEY